MIPGDPTEYVAHGRKTLAQTVLATDLLHLSRMTQLRRAGHSPAVARKQGRSACGALTDFCRRREPREDRLSAESYRRYGVYCAVGNRVYCEQTTYRRAL